MSGTYGSVEYHHESGLYEIRLKGHLDNQRANWFDDLTIIALSNGETLLVGHVADQAALYGVLKKLRDLGIPLLSVNRIESGQTDQPEIKH